MIITRNIAIRLAIIMLVAVLVQLSFLSFIWIGGATPGLVAVVVIVIGLLGGAVSGAVFGFIIGLLVDTMLLGSLGFTSLVLLATGYLAGRWREDFHLGGIWRIALVASALVLFAAIATGLLQLAIGVDADVNSGPVVRETLVKGLLAFPVTLVCYPLISRFLRPALVEVG